MTLTELTNGDVLTIMRASPPGTLSKFYCVSSDGGRSWSKPQALTFDNGEPLLSPSAISRFIRSTRNGKLYWIGNMYPFRAGHYLSMPPQPATLCATHRRGQRGHPRHQARDRHHY